MEYLDPKPNRRLPQYAERLAACQSECEHIWKNMIRIEQLKKEKLRQKNETLRKILHQQ